MITRRFLKLALVTPFLLTNLAAAFPGTLNVFSAEPEPFRRDEIEGRDFNYSNEAFLHRFSYKLRSEWQELWDQDREGFVISAGSVNTRQLYSVGLLRKTIEFDKRFFGVMRYQRSEDFDSRYDRFLTGVGVNLAGGWALSIIGDIVGEKADIDPQFELGWSGEEGSRFRFAFIAVDHFYNQKNSDNQRYESQPYTLFAEGKWCVSKSLILSSWVNWNPDLDLKLEDDTEFSYQQLSYNASAAWKIGGSWQFISSAGGQTGTRGLNDLEHAAVGRQWLNRDNVAVTFESQYRHLPRLKSFHGVHYFLLQERGTYLEVLPAGGDRQRSEYMAYGGVVWQAAEKVVLAPGIYMDFIDSKEAYAGDYSWEDQNSFLAKLDLPVEYHFSERAMTTFNTTALLHKASFGGFNVQFLLLF